MLSLSSMNYWLMKSEPDTFSVDDLMRQPNKTVFWDGVRNYQARNFLRDKMKINDLAFFYHSNCKAPGIVGIVKIVSAGYADATALNPESNYFDPKSSPDNPRWYGVDIQLQEKFSQILTLQTLRRDPHLKNMVILRKGNRLSVTPVTEKEWEYIQGLLQAELMRHSLCQK